MAVRGGKNGPYGLSVLVGPALARESTPTPHSCRVCMYIQVYIRNAASELGWCMLRVQQSSRLYPGLLSGPEYEARVERCGNRTRKVARLGSLRAGRISRRRGVLSGLDRQSLGETDCRGWMGGWTDQPRSRGQKAKRRALPWLRTCAAVNRDGLCRQSSSSLAGAALVLQASGSFSQHVLSCRLRN